jgi:EmrB/QacA subfamily drug resistance transporter
LATVLGSGIAFLDATVVNVALPALGRDLQAGLSGLQWTVDAYLLTLSALLLVGGSLADLHGRRRMFIAGLLWFAAASAACGLAPNTGVLIAARALQGAAAALLVPGSLAVLRACFHPDDQAAAVGAWSGLSGVTTAVGPLLGGWLIDAASWRWVFFLNLPLAGVAVAAALRAIPESRAEGARRIDAAGAVAATIGLAGVVFALIEWRSLGARTVALPAVAGILALAALAVIESRKSDPMLPISLFRSRQFAGANAVTLAVYFALGGAMFFVALALQRVLGWPALAAGAALMPITVLLLLLSPLAARLASRIGYRIPMTAGPLLAGAGLLLLAPLRRGSSYVSGILPGVTVLGLGLAATVAPLTTAVLEGADERHAGVAAGVNTAIARVAALLAIALLPLLAGMADGSTEALAGGFARAMCISAGVCAAGAACALVTLRS